MKRIGIIALMIAATSVILTAQELSAEPQPAESVEVIEIVTENQPESEAADRVHFTWGADLGAGIDLTGSDMSVIDFNAAFGVKWKYIKFVGAGIQADVTVSNSCRSYPVFLLFRTNFRKSESLLFWDLRLGASINYLEDNLQQTGAYVSTGLGINLARGDKFSSHMIIGYNFRQRKDIVTEEVTLPLDNLHYASVKIGLCF